MSTEPPIGSKENPAPLDGYESAKPDEPLFPLQGGDPLGWVLTQLWANLARVRAGVISGDADWIMAVLKVAKDEDVGSDVKEANNLLRRATAAEQLSWTMKDYLTGRVAAEGQTPLAENSLDELARLDVHDLRRRLAAKISNFRCELIEYMDKLIDLEWPNDVVLRDADQLNGLLSVFHDLIEIRRGR